MARHRGPHPLIAVRRETLGQSRHVRTPDGRRHVRGDLHEEHAVRVRIRVGIREERHALADVRRANAHRIVLLAAGRLKHALARRRAHAQNHRTIATFRASPLLHVCITVVADVRAAAAAAAVAVQTGPDGRRILVVRTMASRRSSGRWTAQPPRTANSCILPTDTTAAAGAVIADIARDVTRPTVTTVATRKGARLSPLSSTTRAATTTSQSIRGTRNRGRATFITLSSRTGGTWTRVGTAATGTAGLRIHSPTRAATAAFCGREGDTGEPCQP